jgi:hypothetical protein
MQGYMKAQGLIEEKPRTRTQIAKEERNKDLDEFHRMLWKFRQRDLLGREVLYRELWEKPVRAVAADFECSDSYVHRAARVLFVPKPPRGYWLRDSKHQRRPAFPKLKKQYADVYEDATQRALELVELQRQWDEEDAYLEKAQREQGEGQ